ncbi:MAG: hypothetical protein IJU52_08260 [Clostridia bacterium]|nr:hypothetical protein [Clostridia bacterium]
MFHRPIRILSLILTVFALSGALSSCADRTAENVSENAVAYFNTAWEICRKQPYSSNTVVFCEETEEHDGKSFKRTFCLLLEGTYDRGAKGNGSASARYGMNVPSAADVRSAELEPFFTYTLREGAASYLYAGETEERSVRREEDFVMRIGAAAFGGKMPRSFFAAETDGVLRVDLSFRGKDQLEGQSPLISLVSKALLGRETDGVLSAVSVTSEIDAATGAFLNYTVDFTFEPKLGYPAKMHFTLTETMNAAG